MYLSTERAKRVGAGFLITLMLSGCAGISQQKFNENPSAASAYEVCKAIADQPGDSAFVYDLRMELRRRGVDEVSACPIVIEKRKNAVAAGIIGTLAVVAVVAAAKNGGGGSAGGSAYAPVSDFDWAWDEFYGSNGTLVWQCRGKQTRQFADNSRCAYKPKNDLTWPNKQAI